MTTDAMNARASFELRVDALRGRHVLAVGYWDIHSFGPEPADWDYGDWHHAVMGVELTTDGGPVTITWTATFHPYGVEVFLEPIDGHIVLGEAGPERNGPDAESRWNDFVGAPIRDAAISWDTFTIGPSMKANGEIVGPRYIVGVPTALRLDFDPGPVWFVAAIPQFPDEGVFIPGDEIMVVFAASKMRQMGYTDPTFVG